MGSKVKIVRSAKRLKPFFWNKVANTALTTSVWNDVSSDFSVDMDDLEATFTIDNNASAPSQIRSSTRKQSVTTLLDITRANNVGKSAQ
jgi:diaphanous 1